MATEHPKHLRKKIDLKAIIICLVAFGALTYGLGYVYTLGFRYAFRDTYLYNTIILHKPVPKGANYLSDLAYVTIWIRLKNTIAFVIMALMAYTLSFFKFRSYIRELTISLVVVMLLSYALTYTYS